MSLNTFELYNFYFNTTQITLAGNIYYSVRVFNIKDDIYNIYYQYLNGGNINSININHISNKEINNIKKEIKNSSYLSYNDNINNDNINNDNINNVNLNNVNLNNDNLNTL
jgi:hypothetical protein